MELSKGHGATLEAIFASPVRAGIVWATLKFCFGLVARKSAKGAGPEFGSLSTACARFFTGRTRRRRLTRVP
jgi:hypothetical protein